MWFSKRRLGACVLAAAASVWTTSASAEVKLVEANGWTVSTDGRVNGFVSHLWGDDRPDGLQSMQWVGFNETGNIAQEDANGKLRRTRIRGGYVPSTLAFNVKKQLKSGLTFSGRVEIGMQLANQEPSAPPPEPTWMQPRSVFLEVSDAWGSVKIGRDLSLFPRGNLIMNYELGHAYGVGFPCSYEFVFGGACGHVGFGTLWPDFRPQITYSTPNIGDVFQLSVGAFDPRTVQTFDHYIIRYPRFEGEAVAKHLFSPDWGFKLWANGTWQQLGRAVHKKDANQQFTTRKVYVKNPFGVGGGATGYFGPVKAGVSGYAGKGMDAYEFLTFNPVFGTRTVTPVPNESVRFRPTRGFLAEASVTIGSTWVMGGFGQAQLDRMPSDAPILTPNAAPLLRTQTGISAGVFHRIDAFVLGLDYFNANYGFDARVVEEPIGSPLRVVQSKQMVHIINGGGTFEW
jgi:hypothetical protein